MKKKDIKYEFQRDMNMRTEILYNLVANYNYTKYLFLNSSTKSLNPHWVHIRNTFFSMLYIDLAKLFVESKNQKFNFFDFLNEISKDDYKEFRFEQKMIDEFRNNLTSQISFFKTHDLKGKEHCGIKYYRDKIFAHYEMMSLIIPKDKFFKELEPLINLAFEIVNKTSKTVLNREFFNSINSIDLSDLNIN